MKKIITNSANKVLLFVLLIVTTIPAFAADGGNGGESRWKIFFSMPQVWIAIAGVILCVYLAIFIGKNKNEHAA